MLEHLTKENFNDFIKNNSLCVVDFWATWCGPCRMLTPVLEKINEENGYAIGKINVDEEEELALAFSVQAIPTLILFKDGQQVKMTVGYHDLEELEEFITK